MKEIGVNKNATINEVRFAKYLRNNNFSDIESVNFYSLFDLISDTSRKTLETRWGLPDGKYCPSFSILAKKLEIDYATAKKQYEHAMTELHQSRFAMLVYDGKSLGLSKATGFGRLAYSICHKSYDLQPQEVKADALLEAVNSLPDKQKAILKLYFGLEADKPLSLQEVASHFRVTTERINQIATRGIRTLRVSCSDFLK